jgi:hypothetical protein
MTNQAAKMTKVSGVRGSFILLFPDMGKGK